jgi:hypothetical protein
MSRIIIRREYAPLQNLDALAKLLIEKGVITQQEFLAKISEERSTYQRILNQTRQ